MTIIVFTSHNGDQVMEDEMGRACSMNGEEKKNAYKI
jgi:hypothetical protein